ncbi:50S ribosomal protein L25 [Enterobacteriaceae endosymbiont of Donacia tomentosa]|uniref:50S ribosomal protein L25 n=1 Tax=Enterobacteriaceae endosymbiont of Donacia tomentosa TaxID=2675787 RepID=UPI001448B4F2|nr:50S ribosomal protein L25 [Enterobacteriaceae endosymbiont of Donacia tomentosa]QJC31516.1 50S ribosomal protein L25 [Enterobacteriaceae endosymbiont of Donacia tomentosa]
MHCIKCFQRIKTGKKFSKHLRKNNKFPAIIYGKKIKEISIFIKNQDMSNVDLSNFLNKKLNLIDEQNNIFKVKVLDIQYHPYKNKKVYHIDFLSI